MKGKIYIFAVAVIIVAMAFSGCKKEESIKWNVTTESVTNVTAQSALLVGQIKYDGNDNMDSQELSYYVSKKGFYIDTNADMSNPKHVYFDGIEYNDIVVFHTIIDGLEPNTSYYYYAYGITNEGEEKKGEIKTFKTLQ